MCIIYCIINIHDWQSQYCGYIPMGLQGYKPAVHLWQTLTELLFMKSVSEYTTMYLLQVIKIQFHLQHPLLVIQSVITPCKLLFLNHFNLLGNSQNVLVKKLMPTISLKDNKQLEAFCLFRGQSYNLFWHKLHQNWCKMSNLACWARVWCNWCQNWLYRIDPKIYCIPQ